MGVYFPNMKKPPTCSECPVKLDCGLYWDVPDGGIDSNCTIVYIKNPYGRLIDADQLMNNLGDVEYKGAIKRVLIQAPTIIEADNEVSKDD